MVKGNDKIGIYYLGYHREYALPIMVYFLKMIKDSNKKHIIFYILADYDNEAYRKAQIELESNGIQVCFKVMAGKYIDKIKWAIEQNNEYAWKMDDDVFLNQYLIDFMIENRGMLNDDNNLLLSPLLSAGIPTHDRLADNFLTTGQKKLLHDEFLKTRFFKFLGCDYSFLNAHTLDADSWDCEAFYQSVSTMSHHFKGIHPIRLNKQSALMMNDFVIENFDKFLAPQEYGFLDTNYPYLCNSCFLIKSDTWKSVVMDKSLYVDSYDEVPLNKYRDRSGKKMVYIDKSVGLHIIFNTCIIQSEMEAHEREFVSKIRDILKKDADE